MYSGAAARQDPTVIVSVNVVVTDVDVAVKLEDVTVAVVVWVVVEVAGGKMTARLPDKSVV